MQEKSHYPRVRPAADIVETGSGVQVMVNMPGVRMNDLKIVVYGPKVRIRASSRCPLPEVLESELRNLEFGNVEYALDIGLPGLLNETPKVALCNGVLTLTFVMEREARGRMTLQ